MVSALRSPKLVFFLLVLLVAAGGRFLAGGRASPPCESLRRLDLAALVPKGAIAYLTVDGGPCQDAGKELGIAGLLAEPEVAAFLAPLRSDLDGHLSRVAGLVRKMSGLGIEEALAVLRNRVAVAWLGLEREEDEVPGRRRVRFVPDVVVALDFRNDVAAMRRWLEVFEHAVFEWGGGTFSDANVAGLPVRKYTARPEAGVDAWFLVQDAVFLLATREASLGSVLAQLKSGGARDGLAADPAFRRVSERVNRSKTVASCYLDLPRLVDALRLSGTEVDSDIETLAAATGVDRIRALGYGMDLDGRAIRDRFFLDVPGGAKWLQALATEVPERPLASRLPASTGASVSLSLAPERVLAFVRDIADEVGFGTILGLFLGQAGRAMNADLGKDVLGVLGPECAAFVQTTGRSLVPEPGLLVQLRDREKAERMLDRALGFAPAHRELELEGHRVRILDVPVGDFEIGQGLRFPVLRPTFAIIDSDLVVLPWPSAMRTFLAARSRTPGAAETDTPHRSLAKRLFDGQPGADLVAAYVDLPRVAGFALDNAAPLAQLLAQEEVGVDLVRWPHTDSVVRHLSSFACAARVEREGLAAECSSPLGLLLPVFLAWEASTASILAAGTVHDGQGTLLPLTEDLPMGGPPPSPPEPPRPPRRGRR